MKYLIIDAHTWRLGIWYLTGVRCGVSGQGLYCKQLISGQLPSKYRTEHVIHCLIKDLSNSKDMQQKSYTHKVCLYSTYSSVSLAKMMEQHLCMDMYSSYGILTLKCSRFAIFPCERGCTTSSRALVADGTFSWFVKHLTTSPRALRINTACSQNLKLSYMENKWGPHKAIKLN